MTDLIPIKNESFGDETVNAVNARDLYDFLQSKQRFADWIVSRLDGFFEGKDFFINLGKSTGGRPTKEYIITLDVAKHIAMLESNEQGRVIRAYFIEFEQKARAAFEQLVSDPIIGLRLRQIETQRQLDDQNRRLELMESNVARFETADNYFTIMGYASFVHRPVNHQVAQLLGKRAARLCYDNGYIMGTVPDPRFGRVKTYPVAVLDKVFRQYFAERDKERALSRNN